MRAIIATTLGILLAAGASAQTNQERTAGGGYARSHDYDLVHERIALSHFDWDSTAFDGDVAVTLVALRPAFDSVVLDAGRLLAVRSVRDAKGALAFAAHGDTLVVRLRRAAAFGDTVRFAIAYHGTVTNGRGLTFLDAATGHEPHPQQIWSQGEAMDNHYWFPTYDFPNDRLTWEMVVTVPREFTVVSNGRLVSDAPHGDGTHTVTWRLDHPAPSYLASIVVAPLVKLRDAWQGRPVDYYVYRGTDTAQARRLFAETPDQIAVFSRLTGVAYPWNKYAQTTVADFFGGMENVSATTLVDWIPDRAAYLDRPWYHFELIAHELAHQWFGDYVTTADWANTWLNEGFATFMVGPYWRERVGPQVAEDYYLGKYSEFMGTDRRRRMPIAAEGSNNIYPKGALALEMLRKHLGDRRFWAGVHRYLTDHAFGNATTDDFRQAMLAATGENLDWFFDEWFYQAGYPEFKVIASYDKNADRLTLLVQQVQGDTATADSTGLRFGTPAVFRMPAAIRVGTARGDVTRRVMLDARMQTFTFDSLGGAPTMVIFDDGNAVLKTLAFDQPSAWLAEALARDADLWDRWWAIGQLAKRDTDAVAGAALAKAATGADYPLTRAQAAEALGAFRPSIALPALTAAMHDTSARVRAAALRGLRTLGGDTAAALATNAFNTDPSYDVRATAVRTLSIAPYAVQRPVLVKALGTWSYRDVIGNAAVLGIAMAGDTTLLDAVNAQVGALNFAPYALASLGRRGSARAYDLLAAHLTDARRSTRQAVGYAMMTAVPKSIAVALVSRARTEAKSAAVRTELDGLLERLAKRPDGS